MFDAPVSEIKPLQDSFGRRFPYLRLSITDVCNFRCQYCLPDGYRCESKPQFLNTDEIQRLVGAFAELGVQKIRITGGEPTVRPDFAEIAAAVASHPAITHTAFTTNGYRLRDHAKRWRDAGLRSVNVSVDSLNAENFYRITGHDRLDEVLEGVDAALDVGFEAVKLNVVLLKGLNDHEWPAYSELARHKAVTIRFIELMQTGDNLAFFKERHVSADGLRDSLEETGWQPQPRQFEAGPAEVYSHAEYKGKIGLIAPYAPGFCQSCNRLRVTATGDLRLCLFGESGTPLRDLLQSDDQKEALKTRIAEQLAYKASSHFLPFGKTGITPHLASVGG